MDLRTTYLDIDLKNPIVASSSPLSHNVDGIKKLEDAGAAGVVMYSLFEEQLDLESGHLDYFLALGENHAESHGYFPNLANYNVGPDAYLELIRVAKSEVDIPI